MELTQQRLDAIFAAHQSGNFELLLKLAKQLQADFPKFVLGYKAAGIALLAQNKIKDAIAEMQKTIEIDANDDEALANLGKTLINFATTKQDIQQGQYYLQKYLLLTENKNTNAENDNFIRHLLAETYINQAKELYDLFPLLSLKKYETATKFEANNVDALMGLAKCYGDIGEIEQAFNIFNYLETIATNNEEVHISKLRYSNYLPGITIKQMGKIAQKTKSVLSENFRATFAKFTNNNIPKFDFTKYKKNDNFKITNRKFRLNIGFISGDFRYHAVAKFIKSLLEYFISTKAKFDFYAYPTSNKFDFMSGKLKPLFTKWTAIYKLDDVASAQQIYQDNIHILFDLSGYTKNARMGIFVLKPAPIQISWIGWFGTTAIEAMDYFIADEFCVPNKEAELQFTEKVIKMPDVWECFSANEFNPPPPTPTNKWKNQTIAKLYATK